MLGGGCQRLKLCYLDDICHQIDDEYDTNRKRHEQENHAQNVNKFPLWRRVVRGMKHPLRAAWHLSLRIKSYVKNECIQAKIKHYKYRNQAYLKKYLLRMKPSALLLYVLHAPIKKNIQCQRLEEVLRIDTKGNVSGCWLTKIPFGNLVSDGELDEIYHSTYARIIKLSSLNRSYCLCNLNVWCRQCRVNEKPVLVQKWATDVIPKSVRIGFDRSCNLCCRSCCTQPYVMDEATQQRAALITQKLLRSDYLAKTPMVAISCMGEVFYSPYYRQILAADVPHNDIKILSNGTLFNEDNWRLLSGKYKQIDVRISVDAATAETYQKLRGADFNHLMENLKLLSDLRHQRQIRSLGLNFVVQRDNFREMPAFVKMAQTLGADRIRFQRLNNLGSFTAQEWQERCLVLDDKYLAYELWCILQDPIFKDPIVDLQAFQIFFQASKRRYRRRYTREQKRRRSV